MATTQTEGIILRKRVFKEHDRIYVVYTEKFGKLELVAQGASKIQSKLAGHLEPFCVSHLFIAHGRLRDRIAGSIIKKSNHCLKSSWTGIALASFLAETVDILTRPYHQDSRIFNTMENALTVLDRSLTIRLMPLRAHFSVMSAVLKIISFAGYQPFLDQCVVGGEDLLGPIAFSPRRGGFVCQRCAPGELEKISISDCTAELLRFLLKNDINLLSEPVNTELKTGLREVINIIHLFLENIAERQILTKRFIKV